MRALCIAALGVVSMVPRCCCKGPFRSVVLGEGGVEDEVAQCPREAGPRGQVGIAGCRRFMFPRRLLQTDWFSIHGGGFYGGAGGTRGVGQR
jgi:hypothetical protein